MHLWVIALHHMGTLPPPLAEAGLMPPLAFDGGGCLEVDAGGAPAVPGGCAAAVEGFFAALGVEGVPGRCAPPTDGIGCG